MGLTGSKSMTTGLKHCSLWKSDRSPACRAVMMTLDAMNISITEIDVDLDKCEHKMTEMTVMNPLQTLPIFKDRGLILCDSHAISTYIASRYCSSERLLPSDAAGRALVDQLMHYDSSVLQPRYRTAANPILYENCRCVMPEHKCEIECAYIDLETFLTGRPWFGGSWLTLADIAVAASVSSLDVIVPIDKHKFPNLSSWLYRISEEMFYLTGNKKGLLEYTRRLDSGFCDSCDDNTCSKCPRSSFRRRSCLGDC